MGDTASHAAGWPRLRVDDWTPTRETLHLWLQIVGKIEMASTPLLNHWWNVTYEVTPRGLRTRSLLRRGAEAFEAEFDFADSVLVLRSSTGASETVALRPRSVADFFSAVEHACRTLGIECAIWAAPNELETAIPFAEDTADRPYDPHAVRLFWRQLLQIDAVFEQWRAGFAGKASPVQLFWGSMDLSSTRYSGRGAPPDTSSPAHCPPWVMVEAESRENVAAGFWPGGSDEGSFYVYAYPAPPTYAEGTLTAGSFDHTLGEYILPYRDVRTAADPEATLLGFLQECYARAADLAHWDRALLDVDPDRLAAHLGRASARGPQA
ncbi:DUF5996 family protein [uncultured Microbacterium sp.]|uniref:DUF5996 family protein n=1 Tax=uncultured Microbacterium sp. TaxID=191216 RepID=UPI00260086A2|nr:DUF5996 family protein [uncultured Microbacterium sp.]